MCLNICFSCDSYNVWLSVSFIDGTSPLILCHLLCDVHDRIQMMSAWTSQCLLNHWIIVMFVFDVESRRSWWNFVSERCSTFTLINKYSSQWDQRTFSSFKIPPLKETVCVCGITVKNISISEAHEGQEKNCCSEEFLDLF